MNGNVPVLYKNRNKENFCIEKWLTNYSFTEIIATFETLKSSDMENVVLRKLPIVI